MVIDDEEMLRRALQRLLKGHDVVTAEGGTRAIEIVREDQAFDVVVCDIMMPDLDGPAVYEAIAAEFPALAERFVFLTGGAFTARTKEFLGRVSVLVLEKPIEREVLCGVVERLFAKRQAGVTGGE